MFPRQPNFYLGILCTAFAIVLLFVCIPLDTESGIVERSRGSYTIGDSLAPTIAATILLLSGLILLAFFPRSQDNSAVTLNNLRYISAIIVLTMVGTIVMRFAGPLAVFLLADLGDYRSLRDTVPWKYIGFVLGGIFVVFGIISFVDHKFSWAAFFTSLIAVIGMIALYDLPFEDLLLPPNGDFK